MTVETDADVRRREAAAWFARLKQRRVASEDVQAFSEWRRSPQNAEAFSRIEAMWDAAEVLAHDEDIVQLTLAAAAKHRRRPAPRLAKAWRPAFAVIAGAAVLGVFAIWLAAQPRIYATQIGERRQVELADGSAVTLDTASRIAVKLRRGERRVELIAGQAFFDVREDPTRPFVVHAGETRVTALGTRFDVRLRGDDVRVVLVTGRVRVEAPGDQRPRSWTLEPGQQVAPGSAIPQVVRVDAAEATSWVTGRLIFDRTPLAEAVAEVNRYSTTQVELRAPGVAGIQVSGAFDAGDLEGFVSALTALYPLRVVSADRSLIVVGEAPEEKNLGSS